MAGTILIRARSCENCDRAGCLHTRKTRRKLRKVFSFWRNISIPKTFRQPSASSMMIPKKVVLFDLGGVIVTPPQLALQKYCEEVGLPRDFIKNVIIRGRANNVFGRLEKGQLTVTQFATEFEMECLLAAEERGIDFPKKFSATDMMKFKDPQLIPEMLNAVAVLKENGIQTCAVTNNYIDNTENRDYAAGGLTAFTFYFDEFVESCRVGIRKPDPRIFEEALQRLGVEADEAVFLDDLELNIKAANELGMSTILVKDTHTALEELKQITGVDVFKQAGPIAVDPELVTHGYVTTRSRVKFHFTELGSGPPVLLCHGFPESWYAWRKQMPMLALAGFRTIALDMKGFGESSHPTEIRQYTLERLCRDMTEFLDALGLAQVTIIGQGIGAALAWAFANHNTDRVRAVGGINTPFSPPTSKCNPLVQLKENPGFRDYLLYFQEPGVAEAELEADIERFLKIVVRSAAEMECLHDFTLYSKNVRERGGLLVGAPAEPSLSSIYTEADLKYHTRQLKKSGLRGGLNWFRNIEANWEWNLRAEGRKLLIPALMVTAGRDRSQETCNIKDTEYWVPSLTRGHIEECGYWTTVERPAELNKILLSWLFKIHCGEHTPLLPM